MGGQLSGYNPAEEEQEECIDCIDRWCYYTAEGEDYPNYGYYCEKIRNYPFE